MPSQDHSGIIAAAREPARLQGVGQMRIEHDLSRFKQIVRGKIRQNLRKYVTHGELIGRRGRDLFRRRRIGDDRRVPVRVHGELRLGSTDGSSEVPRGGRMTDEG